MAESMRSVFISLSVRSIEQITLQNVRNNIQMLLLHYKIGLPSPLTKSQ